MFLSLRQGVTRATLALQRRWWSITAAKCDLAGKIQRKNYVGVWFQIPEVNEWSIFETDITKEVSAAKSIAEGRFSFLDRTVEFSDSIDWHTPLVSHLWRYNLHYFGYVRSLMLASEVGGSEAAYDTFRRLVLSWIEGNKQLRGDGWRPYTLSLRIANWLQAAATWAPRLAVDSGFSDILFRSLFAQARMLRRQLEFDVRGNHLLENLRGLLWAGVAYKGAEAREWVKTALQLLEEETAEQVLADGSHFERTPGYHCTVLKDYLEIALLLERNTSKCPIWVREAVSRQAFFLREILGPRQRIPLIKDTTYDSAPNPDDLLNIAAAWLHEPRLKPAAFPSMEIFLLLGKAEWEKVSAWPKAPLEPRATALPVSGFYVLSGRDGEHMVIDAGKPCPDYLPAHAHADTFSFEYHVRGAPVIVDSGVYEYQTGPWRDFFRSTRAHNTIEIGGDDSSEVWGSFRVGRRARPRVKCWQSTIGRAEFLAMHDGYRYLRGEPVHERAVIWRESEYLILIDRVTGIGTLPLVSHLHFHPLFEPKEESPGLWTIDVQGASLWLHRIGGGDARSARGCDLPSPQGWYSERFGAKESNRVLSLRHHATLPHASGYAFSSYPLFNCTIERHGIEIGLRVEFAGGTCSYRISENSVDCLP